jgi:hypothetical protein
MLFFILYQEIWVNKKLYKKFVSDNIPKQERSTVFLVLGIMMIIFLSPFIYVVFALFTKI